MEMKYARGINEANNVRNQFFSKHNLHAQKPFTFVFKLPGTETNELRRALRCN